MDKKKLTLEESNAKFNALPPKQQMVQIAKDILAQQAAGKFEAKGGEYTGLADNMSMALAIDRSGKKTIQEFLTIDPPVCTVCARGAMMLSRVRLGNSVDQDDAARMRCSTPIPSIPMGIQKTLEALFEGAFDIQGMQQFRNKMSQKRYDEFLSEIVSLPWNKSDRLTAIFQNIIKNEGDYVTKNGVNLTSAIWNKQERDRTKRRKK